ncbi:transporter [Domibacillus aminovorans]|uniref:Transporter n=1 Tax=Domibacillus aminovorans TaxID=29332 RepID=A0A177KHJ9_9BACI|nr:transporter [Domibacillus aminovorans]
MKNNVVIGALLCLVASISWGAMFPVANHAFQYIDPFYFTIIRYGSVTVLLIAILLWKEGIQAFRLEGRGLPLWFFGSMAFAVYNLLIFWGQDLLGESGVMLASIMESLMPMISIVLLWIFKRNQPHVFTLLCVFVAFIGVSLVITKGDIQTFVTATSDFIPALFIFIAVVGWVVYTIGGNQFGDWSALRYSTLSCLLGTATALAIVLAATFLGHIPVPTVETIKIVSPDLLFMIIFPGLIALLGWNIGIGILSPLNGILFINFVPVTTLIISIVQGYKITSFDMIGTILIIVSLISNNLFLRLHQKKRTAFSLRKQSQINVS